MAQCKEVFLYLEKNPKVHETDDTIKTATSFFNLSASNPNKQIVQVMWESVEMNHYHLIKAHFTKAKIIQMENCFINENSM